MHHIGIGDGVVLSMLWQGPLSFSPQGPVSQAGRILRCKRAKQEGRDEIAELTDLLQVHMVGCAINTPDIDRSTRMKIAQKNAEGRRPGAD